MEESKLQLKKAQLKFEIAVAQEKLKMLGLDNEIQNDLNAEKENNQTLIDRNGNFVPMKKQHESKVKANADFPERWAIYWRRYFVAFFIVTGIAFFFNIDFDKLPVWFAMVISMMSFWILLILYFGISIVMFGVLLEKVSKLLNKELYSMHTFCVLLSMGCMYIAFAYSIEYIDSRILATTVLMTLFTSFSLLVDFSLWKHEQNKDKKSIT